MHLNRQWDSIHRIRYRVILITKDKRRCISREMFKAISLLLKDTGFIFGGRVLNTENHLDHIAFLVELPPQISITSFLDYFDRTSSKDLKKRFGKELKDHFFDRKDFWEKKRVILTEGYEGNELIEEIYRKEFGVNIRDYTF